MPINSIFCPHCGASNPSPLAACVSCGWLPVSLQNTQPLPTPRRRISRRTALGLAAGVGVLALGGSVWIGLTRKSHPPLLTYTGHHAAQITALTWSSDGNTIASGDSSGNVLVWDSASGETRLTCHQAHSGSISSVCWSPDGTSLLAGYDRALVMWDAQSGKSLLTTTHLTGPAAYSPQGNYSPCYLAYPLLIAACQDQNLVHVFPSTSLDTPIASLSTGPIGDLAFAPYEGIFDLAVVMTS
ncbi:MAG TPA: WD40 repeat domain-containing protein, partial [Ktedonobacteraceae bacterium]|nr:WD40 repeat domain-containing protein [Ktedonobacteraceae bacterium]